MSSDLQSESFSWVRSLNSSPNYYLQHTEQRTSNLHFSQYRCSTFQLHLVLTLRIWRKWIIGSLLTPMKTSWDFSFSWLFRNLRLDTECEIGGFGTAVSPIKAKKSSDLVFFPPVLQWGDSSHLKQSRLTGVDSCFLDFYRKEKQHFKLMRVWFTEATPLTPNPDLRCIDGSSPSFWPHPTHNLHVSCSQCELWPAALTTDCQWQIIMFGLMSINCQY